MAQLAINIDGVHVEVAHGMQLTVICWWKLSCCLGAHPKCRIDVSKLSSNGCSSLGVRNRDRAKAYVYCSSVQRLKQAEGSGRRRSDGHAATIQQRGELHAQLHMDMCYLVDGETIMQGVLV